MTAPAQTHTSCWWGDSGANSFGCDLATVEDCGSMTVPLQANGMRGEGRDVWILPTLADELTPGRADLRAVDLPRIGCDTLASNANIEEVTQHASEWAGDGLSGPVPG